MRIKSVLEGMKTKRFGQGVAMVLAAVLLFVLGIGVGDGRLRLTGSGQFTDRTGLPANLDYSSVNQVYDTLRQNYNGKLTESQVLAGLKHGLAEATGDPYTEYFTAQEAKTFNGELQGISLTGIGAQLDQDQQGHIVVMAPLNGSPAMAAGLKAKDIITTIDSQSTSGMSLNDAVAKIRGKKGTKVSLGILRGSQQLTLTIRRDTINVPTATGKVLPGNIGYLQVSQFSGNTYDLVKQAIATFRQQGVKKLVLDLRDDPGGEVTAAQDIASLWLPDNSLIMQEKRGNQIVDAYRATGDDPLKGMPTVVLVNGGSASAAEITALALRDNHAATIMGEKSYGKGVVQAVIPFADGSELKVTIAGWYAPGGETINKKGITPNQTVKQTASDTKARVDTQLQAAEAYLSSH